MKETIRDIFARIRAIELSTKHIINNRFIGNYKSAFKGAGIEFADVRAYDAGDDIRHIDWKTSSRMGRLYVKTYQETRENTVLLMIDCRQSFRFTTHKHTKFEKLLELIALLGISVMRSGDRLGAVFYHHDIVKIIPPKKGRRGMWNILKEAFALFNSPPKGVSSHEKVFDKIKYLFPHTATFFWINSDYTLTDSLKKKFRFMVKKHDFIPVVIYDSAENDFPDTGVFALQDPDLGRVKVLPINEKVRKRFNAVRRKKREDFYRFFRHQKTEILEVSTTDQVYEKLFLLFKQRQHHF